MKIHADPVSFFQDRDFLFLLNQSQVFNKRGDPGSKGVKKFSVRFFFTLGEMSSEDHQSQNFAVGGNRNDDHIIQFGLQIFPLIYGFQLVWLHQIGLIFCCTGPEKAFAAGNCIQAEKTAVIVMPFADNKIMSGKDPIKYTIRPDAWQTIKVEAAPAEGATEAYLMLEGNLNSVLYIRNVKVSHTPDNHRDQTKQEKNDTIRYALNKWCDGLMEANAGRIKSFDLIDKPLDSKAEIEPGILDLKHSDEKIFWQDYLEDGTYTGSELYGATVSKAASAAFERHGGNPADLKFFICESGLDDQKRLESLQYWISKWESHGAKIDGINAELNLTYSEDETAQAATVATVNTLLNNLAKTGKLIRLSNFDIKYQDATGAPVSPTNITDAQRQKLADFYGYVIKAYMNTIPSAQQGGICKSNMVDTSSDPVGLWSVDSKMDWVRTATYEAFCKALSGQ